MNHEKEDLEDLIHRYLKGLATEGEARRLEARIISCSNSRELFLRYACLDAALAGYRAEEQSRSVADLQPKEAADLSIGTGPRRGSQAAWYAAWRPLAAAVVAGLILGTFCTSMVMAYMAPVGGKVIPLLGDGFEEGERRWSRGFPDRPGLWGGDAGEVISGSGDIQPFEGRHMVRLEPSSTTTLSYLERIVDLESLPVPERNETRQVSVTASFHAVEPGLRDRYTLRVAAFEQEPGEVRELWVGREWREIEGALTMSKRALSTTADTKGWQTLTATVGVPREARTLVISLASGVFQNPGRKTAHYIDGVRAILVFGPRPFEAKGLNFGSR